MATNFEYFKDEILKIAQKDTIPTLVQGKLVGCSSVDCNECDFESRKCRKARIEWLYAEHIESPKLTKRERAFCEVVQTGWITRNKNGGIHWRDNEPEKNESCWYGKTIAIPLNVLIRGCFSFVKWEDEKPWLVADLLKLEVMEVQEDA